MEDTYRTIAKPVQAIFKEKGSKFLAFAYPVSNENEIQKILDKAHREYYDARHHCYAWRLGVEMQRYRANDDGEPSGTAGLPIFNQIKSKELSNVLVVVVRYFGGILLGTGGLTSAYKTATINVLNEAEIITKTENDQLTVHFDYQQTNEVMKLIKDEKLELVYQQFNEDCHITISIRRSKAPIIIEKLLKIKSVSIENVIN